MNGEDMDDDDRWNQGDFWFVKILAALIAVVVGLGVGAVLAFNFFWSLF